MPMLKQSEEVLFIKYSLAAFLSWINKEFSKRSPNQLTCKTVTGPAALRQMSAMLSRPDKDSGYYQALSKLQYPYLLAAIGDISLDETRNGINKRSYHNIVAAKDMQTGVAIAYNLRPVRVGLGIVFNTDNQDDVLSFATSLLMNAPAFSVIFESENKFNIGIKIVIDPSLSVPPVNYETPGEAYQFNTVVTLETYIGEIGQLRLIKEFKVSIVNQNIPSDVLYEGPKEIFMDTTISFVDQLTK